MHFVYIHAFLQIYGVTFAVAVYDCMLYYAIFLFTLMRTYIILYTPINSYNAVCVHVSVVFLVHHVSVSGVP